MAKKEDTLEYNSALHNIIISSIGYISTDQSLCRKIN